MSITLHCNRDWAAGTCATSLITDTTDREQARAFAERQGWRSDPDGKDYCPGHSGRPLFQGVTVVPINRSGPPPAARAVSPSGGAADTVRAASAHLRHLADATTAELHSELAWQAAYVPRARWFMEGVSNAIPGPPGQLAGLLAPESARLAAHLLDRTVTAADGIVAPIPAEAFLLANNIVRSLSR
ncbi:hypothetical protein [Streptomyces sp. NBC_00198]|uniref:hypothetical protein n=1 Tax=Streptomyces sp. NBC_00198 TaxID=2975677 RepID=UPI00224CF8AF|nr:hypothetical protein [Streptomyces sp. NBC_00198]MCX5285954.1 hypothetical protein [Streptomyces sp. NBC_00198]MCX5286263.1 hypothetical protein [Streptomyces sp. NBC_00198]